MKNTENPMKLDPEGKKRLESMKKTLAAGLPLAGLLAAAAVCTPEASGQWRTAGTPVYRPPEECKIQGRVAPPKATPPEEAAATPVAPSDAPAQPPSEPGKPATEEQP